MPKVTLSSVSTTAVRRVQPARSTLAVREDITARAYDLFLARGCTHGCDVEDWLQAERELRVPSRRQPATKRLSP